MTRRGATAPGPVRPWYRAGRGTIAGLVLALVLGSASHVHAQQAPASQIQASTAPLLFEAVRGNNLAGVKSAVKAGADMTRKDGDGRTALDIALQRGFFDIAQFLIKARQEQLDPPIGRARAAEPPSAESRTAGTGDAPQPQPARSRVPASPPADAPSSGNPTASRFPYVGYSATCSGAARTRKNSPLKRGTKRPRPIRGRRPNAPGPTTPRPRPRKTNRQN